MVGSDLLKQEREEITMIDVEHPLYQTSQPASVKPTPQPSRISQRWVQSQRNQSGITGINPDFELGGIHYVYPKGTFHSRSIQTMPFKLSRGRAFAPDPSRCSHIVPLMDRPA